jgi:hypothetical protein
MRGRSIGRVAGTGHGRGTFGATVWIACVLGVAAVAWTAIAMVVAYLLD